MKERKKYYSPVKSYDVYKRPHVFYKLLRAAIRLFFPDNEVVWKCEKPASDEAAVYVCNHTKIYAPTAFLVDKRLPQGRIWANCYFLHFNMCWKHIKTKVINNRKPKFILYPLAFLLTPVIVLTFRAFNPIPVYHKSDNTERVTFQKAIDTIEEGKAQIIFPERTENPVNKYVFQFNHGFPKMAEKCYKETGKIVKFYPVYCAQKLHTFVIGEPIAYNPDIDIEIQKDDICHYLEHSIQVLGDSLPAHETVIYG